MARGWFGGGRGENTSGRGSFFNSGGGARTGRGNGGFGGYGAGDHDMDFMAGRHPRHEARDAYVGVFRAAGRIPGRHRGRGFRGRGRRR